MIRIRFDPPTDEGWTAWVAECEIATAELIQAVTAGEQHKISDLYKDPRVRRIYIAGDMPPFWGKCAYCESYIYGDQPGDIEHYRPAKRVTHEDNTPIVMVDASGAEIRHPGYFWLAYDFRNLLVACADCNRPSKAKTEQRIGKWDKFPVESFRAWQSGDEGREDPLILNPIYDEPDEYLEIDDTGLLTARDNNSRGEASVRILGLNSRQGLVQQRLEKISQVENSFNMLVLAWMTRNDTEVRRQLAMLERVKDGSAPFALAGRFALKRQKARNHHLLTTVL